MVFNSEFKGLMQVNMWSISQINEIVAYRISSLHHNVCRTSIYISRHVPQTSHSIMSTITGVSLFSAKYCCFIHISIPGFTLWSQHISYFYT